MEKVLVLFKRYRERAISFQKFLPLFIEMASNYEEIELSYGGESIFTVREEEKLITFLRKNGKTVRIIPLATLSYLPASYREAKKVRKVIALSYMGNRKRWNEMRMLCLLSLSDEFPRLRNSILTNEIFHYLIKVGSNPNISLLKEIIFPPDRLIDQMRRKNKLLGVMRRKLYEHLTSRALRAYVEFASLYDIERDISFLYQLPPYQWEMVLRAIGNSKNINWGLVAWKESEGGHRKGDLVRTLETTLGLVTMSELILGKYDSVLPDYISSLGVDIFLFENMVDVAPTMSLMDVVTILRKEEKRRVEV